MKEALDKKLCDKYPDIFANRHKPSYESAMHGGFQCDDGWFSLIDQLCARLQVIQKITKISIIAVQVKEKFGALRFYASIDVTSSKLSKKDKSIWYDLIYDLIICYETKSKAICELCGKAPAQLINYEMILKTVCDKHAKEFEQSTRELHERIKHLHIKPND